MIRLEREKGIFVCVINVFIVNWNYIKDYLGGFDIIRLIFERDFKIYRN